VARVSSIARCLGGFDNDFDRLPNSLGEVGPRRAWGVAEHGIAVARIRVKLRKFVLNRIVERYLKYRTDNLLSLMIVG